MQILARVCWLIDGLHAQGFVHRDIKPDNIIWDPGSSGWRLIDFGIVTPRGSSSHVAFTATYAAPEAASMYKRKVKEFVVDIGLDIWALGVMCLELLLEKPAFGDMTDIDEVLPTLHLHVVSDQRCEAGFSLQLDPPFAECTWTPQHT